MSDLATKMFYFDTSSDVFFCYCALRQFHQKQPSKRCIQETLNEYCTKLGVMDDQIVPGEHSDYEEFNYARYDSVDSVWKCYQNILTGDAVEAR